MSAWVGGPRGRGGVLALTALVMVGGIACSPDPALSDVVEPSASSIPESDALLAALSDDITYDAYLAGYRRFSACMRAAGHALVGESETNQVMQYSVALSAAADEELCMVSEFEPLDVAWQIHQEDTSYSAEVLRRCLAAHSIEVDPSATLVEMDRQLRSAQVPHEDCA